MLQINHACVPNAILVTALEEQPEAQLPFASMVTVRLKALRPIAPGDEINVSYHYNCMAGRRMRRQAMQMKLGFQCRCYHCINAADEETMTDIGGFIFGLLYGQEIDMHGRAYHRNCRQLFDAFLRLQLTGWHFKDWCLILAKAAQHLKDPDWVRIYYFRRLELQWCQKWLGPSHLRTKDLIAEIARIREKEDVATFANISWDFMMSRSAQQVFFPEDSTPNDRLLGKDCIPALQELQAKERRQKKNMANKRNRARKRANKPQHPDVPEAAGPAQVSGPSSDEATISGRFPELHPNDESGDLEGSTLPNEAFPAISSPHTQPNSPKQSESSEMGDIHPSASPSAAGQSHAPEQDEETHVPCQITPIASTTASPANLVDQTQDMTLETEGISAAAGAESPVTLASQIGVLLPPNNAASRTSSPDIPNTLVEAFQGSGSDTVPTPTRSASPVAVPEEADLPFLPNVEASTSASMTPVCSPEDGKVAQSPSEGDPPVIRSPSVGITAPHNIQGSREAPLVENFGPAPLPATEHELPVVSEEDKENHPPDTCPGLDQVQSSSDEGDDFIISTPNELSVHERDPDEPIAAAGAQARTPMPVTPPETLLQGKQYS